MKHFQLIVLLTAAVTLAACQQNSYKITGTVEGLEDGDTLFVITDLSTGLPSDTLIIKDGAFSLKGESDSVELCGIFAQSNPEISALFFTEPGNITIKLGQTPESSTIGGTKANEGLQTLNSMAREYGNKMQELTYVFFDPEATEESKKQTMEQQLKLQSELSAKILEITENNIDNELGYFIVTNFNDDEAFPPAKRQELIAKMPAKYRERSEIKALLSMMEKAEATNEGSTITDFSLPTPDGSELSVMTEVEKNKMTVLDFWASWCGPCRQEAPFMVQLYNKYHEQGLGIVGISLDEDKDAWISAINELGMPWPQMSDLKGWQSSAGQLFQVNSIPFTVVVDQQGNILKKGLRGEELEAFVKEQL